MFDAFRDARAEKLLEAQLRDLIVPDGWKLSVFAPLRSAMRPTSRSRTRS
jgi:hypothetical protein